MQICMRQKCKCEAGYSVKALVPACECAFYEVPPVEVYCGLLLCASCANLVGPDDIFNEEVVQNVTTMMFSQHQTLPDFSRSKLQVISCNDLHLLMLEARHSTIH